MLIRSAAKTGKQANMHKAQRERERERTSEKVNVTTRMVYRQTHNKNSQKRTDTEMDRHSWQLNTEAKWPDE